MLVLGVNTVSTRFGKRLKDGGLCIIQDGDILVATAEERISRVKYAGGFDQSLAYVSERLGHNLDDFDAIVVSSCCESAPADHYLPGRNLKEPAKLSYIPSHHLSHAYSTFFASPFERALILVMDAGGNVIGPQEHTQWWLSPREQSTYYIGEGDRIDLIGRDFDQPLEAGFGEAYRAFTHYLGWHSYTFSSNTMALAAHGDPDRYHGLRLFDFNDGKLTSRMVNNPKDPFAMVARLASEQGASIPDPGMPGIQLTQEHKDLASFVQKELENALVRKVTYLVESTNIRNVCIAGGIGLNCVANRRILDETPVENVFIQPASGDVGQALGNALYGFHYILGQQRRYREFSPYLGFSHDLSFDHLKGIFPAAAFRGIRMARVDNVPVKVAEMLNNGKIVAWYQGRSEYGPRALGNRSILADPRFPTIREACHDIKKREYFRPFAPSVLEEHAAEYFDLGTPSPYMLLVAKVRPQVASQIPAVLHEDNTARLQTVSRDDNPLFHELISQFYHITGIPMILNTSFNSRGEPIVEDPRQAVNTFLDLELDALVVGDVLIEKLSQPSVSISVQNGRAHEYVWEDSERYDLAEQLGRDFQDFRRVGRSVMGLYSEHIRLARSGKRSTSIRYRPDAIDYPLTDRLPLLDTGSNGRKFQAYPAGEVLVKKLVIKRFGLLDETDARREGCSSLDQLLEELHKIYNHIRDDEFVSIYHIELCDQKSLSLM